MHAVILAGGQGIRLRPYTTVLPKPLVPLGDNEVILDIILGQLSSQGFSSATLAIHHQGALIKAYVGTGSRWGMSVDYAEERAPLGTFGPLFQLRDMLPEHFLVMNGDILTDLRFDELLRQHARSGGPLTVATYAAEHQVEFGVLDVVEGRIVGFTEKPKLNYHVSMGVYGMSRSALDWYEPGTPCGADQFILDLIARKEFAAYRPFSGLWRDIGRPTDYDLVNASFSELREVLLPSAQPAPTPVGVLVPGTARTRPSPQPKLQEAF